MVSIRNNFTLSNNPTIDLGNLAGLVVTGANFQMDTTLLTLNGQNAALTLTGGTSTFAPAAEFEIQPGSRLGLYQPVAASTEVTINSGAVTVMDPNALGGGSRSSSTAPAIRLLTVIFSVSSRTIS